MIDEELFDAEEKMEKAVSVVKEDLATLRTGRANPNMFGRIHVDNLFGAGTDIRHAVSNIRGECEQRRCSTLGALQTKSF